MLIRGNRNVYCTFVLLLCACTALAQETESPAVLTDPNLDANDNAYMDRQAEALLHEVDATLTRVPPQIPEPNERKLALYLLDAVLHDVHAPNRAPVQSFYPTRLKRLADELEQRTPDEGAIIWKLYNHGFIIRTASVTLGFDLHRGVQRFRVVEPAAEGRRYVDSPGFPMPDDVMNRIASECDVLFISHRHADHADPSFAQAFIDRGKPVVAPEEVFKDEPIHAEITHLERVAHEMQQLPIKDGAEELNLVVYPGQQYQDNGIPNNVVLVFTPEGMSFAHNGDQINDPYPEYQEDYKWIDRVHEHHKVDVVMSNCWMNDHMRFTRGFDPQLVLLGHQNELGHQIWDRVPYWGDSEYLHLTLPQLLDSEYPVLVMTWGESYHYVP
ncbi:MAG: MBL fold metallo-hydrolase [Candidatus Hydrogenedentes bacterium]|nr:MBL fold metallo-hydrolase [Candidatus Hydrogenedentota bacterium]